MKFAFITPRYGAEIAHGAEHVCRILAEQVCDRHDVDVLTTCARDERSWENVYPEGVDRIRAVAVRRFPAAATGPGEPVRSPGLLEHLKRHQKNYDALVFFSFHAGTTLQGLSVAPDRSVLFPCAQLTDALRQPAVQEAFASPAALGYLSLAERRLVRAYARRVARGEEVVGIGVEAVPEWRYPRLQMSESQPPEGERADRADDDGTEGVEDLDQPPPHLATRGVLFRRRHRLPDRFAFYGGRVDGDNGSEEMLEYFDSYAATNGDTALVLMGVKMMKLPPEPWLRLAGVLPERDRMVALQSADVSMAPDPDDIAGEHVLESFGVGTPVLASARNRAAVEHCRRGNAGLYYANRDEFVEALRLMMTNTRLRESLGRNGRRYVQQHFRWDAVLGRFERLVARVKGR